MLEKDIEKSIVSYANKLNYFTCKFTACGVRGVPDRIFINPHGFIFFIEFKKSGKKITLNQKHIITKFLERNVKVYVVDNIDYGKYIIELCSKKQI